MDLLVEGSRDPGPSLWRDHMTQDCLCGGITWPRTVSVGGSHDPGLYPATAHTQRQHYSWTAWNGRGSPMMETQSGSNGATVGGGGSNFFSRHQFSRDQLPPDQLSWDQFAMKLNKGYFEHLNVFKLIYKTTIPAILKFQLQSQCVFAIPVKWCLYNEAVWLQHSVSPWGTSLKGGETVDVTCTERDHPSDQTSNRAKEDNTALVIL